MCLQYGFSLPKVSLKYFLNYKKGKKGIFFIFYVLKLIDVYKLDISLIKKIKNISTLTLE